MIYLSRLVLDQRNRAVQRDLADCQQMHRTVMSLFPAAERADPRSAMGVLYRLETNPRTGQVILLLQSGVAPDWSRLEPGYLADTAGEGNPMCKSVDEQYGRLAPGMRLAFRLRANPTRKIDTRSGPDGERRNGRRVELRREEEQLDWLRRKGADCGFDVVEARARPAPGSRAARPGEQTGTRSTQGEAGVERARLTFAAVLFEGELEVRDVARFRVALAKGIGPAKAYGFGLLSVAPAGR